jgi:hypothetical protein
MARVDAFFSAALLCNVCISRTGAEVLSHICSRNDRVLRIFARSLYTCRTIRVEELFL